MSTYVFICKYIFGNTDNSETDSFGNTVLILVNQSNSVMQKANAYLLTTLQFLREVNQIL